MPVSLRTLYMENCSLSKAFLVEFMASVGLPVLEPVLANAFAEASVDTAVTLGAVFFKKSKIAKTELKQM